MRTVVMIEGGRPVATRAGTFLSTVIVVVAQLLVTIVIVEGLRQSPISPLAVFAGAIEWVLAVAWALLLVGDR